MYVLRLLALLGMLNLGSDAIDKAQAENKHLYLVFFKENNEKTDRTQAIVDKALEKLGTQASAIKINVNDPNEKSMVDRFDLKRVPMPFVMVLAPNGAITGGFASATEEQLLGAITSPGAATCVKALQDRKLVLLCLQNNHTTSNEEALKGVEDFKADVRFKDATEIVVIDPLDPCEHRFLKQLSIDIEVHQAVTVLISPPGEVVGKYLGQTTKDQLASDVQNAASGCCCGPGGCCPGGKCGPK